MIATVELFCGIGGFRLACDQLGIKTVWANDKNPLSCQVYENVFGPDEIRLGDIKELKSFVPSHNLLTAGFPCQPFSSAGKKLGTRDARGTLFQEIVKIVSTHTPQWFVLENVKRLLSMEDGDHFATILEALTSVGYFLEWRLLNAMFFGLLQNRQRVVIVGSRIDHINEASVHLANVKDLDIVLRHDFDTLRQYDSWSILEGHKKKFPNWGLCYGEKFYAYDLEIFSEAVPVYSIENILESKPGESFFMDDSIKDRLKSSVFVNRLVGGVRVLFNQNGGARMGYTIFGVDGVAPALTASHSRHYERYKIGDRYRRLTNIEYARLQGFPDDHCESASVFNQYGLYGNAVPPSMVKWVINRLVEDQGVFLEDIQLMPHT